MKWWKEERGEKIFVDYNQNARDRTIASAYSVRPRPQATVSAPLGWDEVADVPPLDFTVGSARAVRRVGDLHARIDAGRTTHAAAGVVERQERDHGQGDMPYPPEYPKMPGEPKRVQPSRDTLRPKDSAGWLRISNKQVLQRSRACRDRRVRADRGARWSSLSRP